MLLPVLLAASQTGTHSSSRFQSWLPFAAILLPNLIQMLAAMLTTLISRIRTRCTSVVTRRIQHTKHVGWWSYNDAGDDDDSGKPGLHLLAEGVWCLLDWGTVSTLPCYCT
jgi:hypothetical protein